MTETYIWVYSYHMSRNNEGLNIYVHT